MAKRRKTDDVETTDHSDDLHTSTSSSIKAESRVKRTKLDLVQTINDLTADHFHDRFIPQHQLKYTVPYARFDIEHKSSRRLQRAELDHCFNLIDTTSAHDYQASTMGWKPQSKRSEMKDPVMHYLLVRSALALDRATVVRAEDDAQRVFAGFLSFMITYDSAPVVPVLYVYEIHLREAYRKHGLGKHLLDIASSIATKCGMSKIMLTCFVSNAAARRFYERYGFKTDTVSPSDRRTRGRLIKTDHLIMSKSIGAADTAISPQASK